MLRRGLDSRGGRHKGSDWTAGLGLSSGSGLRQLRRQERLMRTVQRRLPQPHNHLLLVSLPSGRSLQSLRQASTVFLARSGVV